jgi:hypothetical protein
MLLIYNTIYRIYLYFYENFLERGIRVIGEKRDGDSYLDQVVDSGNRDSGRKGR